jgi:hypothetical protein
MLETTDQSQVYMRRAIWCSILGAVIIELGGGKRKQQAGRSTHSIWRLALGITL